MDFSQVVESRFSCRAYLPKPVSAQTVRRLAEMAQRVPSWGNTQPWKAYVAGGQTADRIRQDMAASFAEAKPEKPEVEMPESFAPLLAQRYQSLGRDLFAWLDIGRQDQKARLAHYKRNFSAFDAPTLVLVTVPDGQTPYVIYDAGAFVAQFCLAAASQGLATCVLAALARYPGAIRRHLPLGQDERLLIGFTLGYADPEAPVNQFRSPRAPLEEMLTLVDVA